MIQSYFDLTANFFVQRPMLLILTLAIPLGLVARFAKIHPTRWALWLAAVPALFSVLFLAIPTILDTLLLGNSPLSGQLITLTGWILAGIDLIILAILAVDFISTFSWGKKLLFDRHVSRVASLGKELGVELELTNPTNRRWWLTIKDDFANEVLADPPEHNVTMEPRSRIRLHTSCTPLERGRLTLEKVYLRLYSRLGLWNQFRTENCFDEVNVYPDMKQIAEYDLLAKTNRLSLMGLRRTRKIGQDNEFERLRDYSIDDNFKHIDWRTTARRRKLTVKEFQSNQAQQIIFMIDCGRMMTGTDEELSLLDYSLNAMLMMAYVALKQGDSVGMITFSNQIHNFTPVKPGVQHINRLLHASCNLQPAYVESRYDQAFLYLRTHCRKRSMVVLITNVIDEINSHQIRNYLTTLTGHHLPLAVLLRDREMFSPLETVDYQNPDSLYQASAAVEVLSWRQQAIRELRHRGVLALDVFPNQLTASIVNQYLEIKARHLL